MSDARGRVGSCLPSIHRLNVSLHPTRTTTSDGLGSATTSVVEGHEAVDRPRDSFRLDSDGELLPVREPLHDILTNRRRIYEFVVPPPNHVERLTGTVVAVPLLHEHIRPLHKVIGLAVAERRIR
jgi:hypothetical protein